MLRYETGLSPQFNGNIAGITYQNQGDILREYGYSYDRLSRLTAARNPNGLYDERGLSYDRNGNLLSLVRTDNGTRVDSLLYSYSGNRLNKVNDQITAVTNNHFPKNDQHHSLPNHYSYDANGNAISDVNRAITSVTYNYLNKPVRITFSGGNWVEYTYDAAGNKLKKTTNTAVTTDYVGGIEYDGLVLKRLPMGEGYIEALPNSSFEYRYSIKDHLGNTRSVFVQDGTTVQRNHYYAFGLSIASLDFSGPGAAWKYQYNGKERQTDFGLNWLDYGARMYDPLVARWHSLDAKPLIDFSLYAAMGNNPAKFIDVDGDTISLQTIEGGYWVEVSAFIDADMNAALTAFASTSEGRAFLAQFAIAGQTIGGVTFTENGSLSDHNLAIRERNVQNNDVFTQNGTTSSKVEDGKLSITLDISANRENWTHIALTIGHEAFIHADLDISDYKDDCILNRDPGHRGSNDHKGWVQGKPQYNKFDKYERSLKSYVKGYQPELLPSYLDRTNKHRDQYQDMGDKKKSVKEKPSPSIPKRESRIGDAGPADTAFKN